MFDSRTNCQSEWHRAIEFQVLPTFIKKNVDSPRRVPSHRVAKATTYWMTGDYKTCINLIDSIIEVPCIMQGVLLVVHNNIVCHQVEQSHSINQYTICANITSVIPVYSQGKRKKSSLTKLAAVCFKKKLSECHFHFEKWIESKKELEAPEK